MASFIKGEFIHTIKDGNAYIMNNVNGQETVTVETMYSAIASFCIQFKFRAQFS